MTFTELQKLLEETFKATRLADIARELNVSPQVVSNWKARDQVPYKYVKNIRKKIRDMDRPNIDTPNWASDEDKRTIIMGYPPEDSYQDEDEQSISDIIFLIYHKLRNNMISVLFFPLFFSIIAFIYTKYYAEPIYISIAKILPVSGKKGGSALSGIAQQFGIGISSQSANSLSSASMFPEIIKSRRLARELLNYKFDTKKYGPDKPLINIIFKTNVDSMKWSEKNIKRAITYVLYMISVQMDNKSPLLRLSVNSFEAQLSADLLSAVIEKLEKILIQFKLSQITEKKLFIENRISEIKIVLTAAEENLKIFRERNRSIKSSPALLLEQARLVREVEVQTQVYITLKSQYEMVQIEEAGETSLMQILDPPEAPTRKASPKLNKNIIFALSSGLFFGLGFVYFKDWYIDNKDNFKIPD